MKQDTIAQKFIQTSRGRELNESGMAILETLPLLIIFVVLIGYMLGCFGVIHTGILNSVAARTYAWETFRHRTDLGYLRGNTNPTPDKVHFRRLGNRVHAINNEYTYTIQGFFPTERRIAMGLPSEDEGRGSVATHQQAAFTIRSGQQNETIAVNPVWIMIQYGLCLDVKCGGGN